MKYCIVISSHPSLPASSYALRFCQALESSTHELKRIFLHSEGVLNGDAGHENAEQWQNLKAAEKLCCAASAEHFFPKQAQAGTGMNKAFKLAGLGQLIEAEVTCDRVITFGQNPKC